MPGDLGRAAARSPAHPGVATAAAKAATSGVPLRDILLADPDLEDKLTRAGITQADIEQALDPAGYLGAAAEFTAAALAAHRDAETVFFDL